MHVRDRFRPKSPLPIALVALGLLAFLAIYQFVQPAHAAHDPLLNSADYIAYTVCHRLPTHSFAIFGRSMPLCARCSGIYLGIIISLTMTWLTGRQRNASAPSKPVTSILLILFFAMVFDGTNSLLNDIGVSTLYQPNNTLRLMTGFGAGLAIAITVSTIFAQTAWQQPSWAPQITAQRELVTQLLMSAALVVLILSNQNTILYVLSVVSAVGVLTILSVLYTTLVLFATRKDMTIMRHRQLVTPAIVGLALACTQIALIATLRFTLTGTWGGF